MLLLVVLVVCGCLLTCGCLDIVGSFFNIMDLLMVSRAWCVIVTLIVVSGLVVFVLALWGCLLSGSLVMLVIWFL